MYIYTTKGELSSKCEEFLAVYSSSTAIMATIFLRLHVATFVRPLFAFYCPLFCTGENAALHFMPRMNAVFALDVAIALRQIKR